MARLILTTQTAPSTPSTDTIAVYPDSTTELLTTMDDAGRIYPLVGTQGAFSAADFTGTDVNTAQPIFDTTHDVFTVTANTAYVIDANFHIHTTGTTSHTLGLLFGGTATLTSIGYAAYVTNAATEVLGAINSIWAAVATVTVVSSALASATHHSCIVRGVVRINAAGTFIPQYQWSAAPGAAGVTLANSYFKLHPIGPGARVVVGAVA